MNERNKMLIELGAYFIVHLNYILDTKTMRKNCDHL